MSQSSALARLAIDIGGTFTDLALETKAKLYTTKVLTTPAAPEQGVLEGVRVILEMAGIGPEAIGLVIHGTTLATNAMIERKGARTALITTEGFRDVLAMGTESRYDQYDLNIVLPEPLVPRFLRFTVPERLDNEGRVLRPLNENAVLALVPKLQAEGVESIAIGFLHAFVNPVHERRAAEILQSALPGVPISLSSEVSPEMREFERFSTTVANAYVQPLMARYLGKLAQELAAMGMVAPLFLMHSGGGLIALETACRFPVRLVESGPAGGAIFAAHIARAARLNHVVSFDMGGTTAKICLIDNGAPQTARSFEVARVGRFQKGSGLPLRIPVIEMVEIGAGGGSIARVDAMGRIAVGPESAGADPGPACYGRGGIEPTVTDANLMLGRYDPDRFAGGKLRLDTAAAERALVQQVGNPLGLSASMAALGVVEMVDENMANAARVHAAESGKALAERTLIAFGGGGGVHAYRLAERLGIRRILVPPGAGVGSAIGFLRAPIAYEVVRSLYQRFATFDIESVNRLIAEMAEEAEAVVARAGTGLPTRQTRTAYMRYIGQGHEIPVPLPNHPLTAEDVPRLRAAYDAAYARFYNRPVPGSDVEVLSYALSLATELPPLPPVPQPLSPYSPEPAETRRVRETVRGEQQEWSVYERGALRPGARLRGPAMIVEDETSVLLGPGWQASIDGWGNVVLMQEGE